MTKVELRQLQSPFLNLRRKKNCSDPPDATRLLHACTSSALGHKDTKDVDVRLRQQTAS